MATMRQSRPPARFSDPVHVVLPRRNVILRPFEGQPPKYARPRRLPELPARKIILYFVLLVFNKCIL